MIVKYLIFMILINVTKTSSLTTENYYNIDEVPLQNKTISSKNVTQQNLDESSLKGELNDNDSIRIKRHPAILIKTRPVRLKRRPITKIYRARRPSKYGSAPSVHSQSHKTSSSSYEPSTFNSNAGSHYAIPSASYGVPSKTYNIPSSSFGIQATHQSKTPSVTSYEPTKQHSYEIEGHSSYEPQYHQLYESQDSYGLQEDSYKSSAISYHPQQSQQPQQHSYSFAEPPVKQSHGSPHQQNYVKTSTKHLPQIPSYTKSQSISYGPLPNIDPPDHHTPSVTSYNPSIPKKPISSGQYTGHKMHGSYNTPIPVYTTKKQRYSEQLKNHDEIETNFKIPVQKYELELDNADNGNLYDTSISSYDVPLQYDTVKYSKNPYQNSNSFEPSDYFQTTKAPIKQTTTKFSAPILPNTYDQEQFNSFKKAKPFSSLIGHTRKRPNDVHDFSQQFDNTLLESQSVVSSNIRNKSKKRDKAPPITNLNAFAINDDISVPLYEYLDDIKVTTPTTTKRPNRYRRKKISKTSTTIRQPNPHVLDTDDLRDAYGESSHVHSTVSRPESAVKFESLKNTNRLPKPAQNVANGVKNRNNDYVQFSISNGDTKQKNSKFHSNYTNVYNDGVIETSKSYSYYAGTIAPPLANYASKRNYDTKTTEGYNTEKSDEQPMKSYNVISSGFYVADISDSHENLKHKDNDQVHGEDDEYENENSEEDDFENENAKKTSNYENYKSSDSVRKPIWDGGNLPKNHKFTSRGMNLQTKI